MDNLAYKYEELYTLEEARIIINVENRRKEMQKAKARREEEINLFKQRILALAMILFSITTALLTKDGTLSLFMLPVGLAGLFAKNKV